MTTQNAAIASQLFSLRQASYDAAQAIMRGQATVDGWRREELDQLFAELADYTARLIALGALPADAG